MKKTHMQWEWGKTLCGRDGWRGHSWSSWEADDSLKSTIERRQVTCRACLKKLKQRPDYLPNVKPGSEMSALQTPTDNKQPKAESLLGDSTTLKQAASLGVEAVKGLIQLWEENNPDDKCACLGASDDCPHPPPCELCSGRMAIEALSKAATLAGDSTIQGQATIPIPVFYVWNKLPDKFQMVIVRGGIGWWTGDSWESCVGRDIGRAIEWPVRWWAPLIMGDALPDSSGDQSPSESGLEPKAEVQSSLSGAEEIARDLALRFANQLPLRMETEEDHKVGIKILQNCVMAALRGGTAIAREEEL